MFLEKKIILIATATKIRKGGNVVEQKYVEKIKTIAQYIGLSEKSIKRITKGGEEAAKKRYYETIDMIAGHLCLPKATVEDIVENVGAKREKKYFETQEDVAEYLGLTLSTVNKLIKNGEIVGERVGVGKKRTHQRFSINELDRYHLAKIKERFGPDFDKELMAAQIIATFFRKLNTDLVIGAMLNGKEFDEAMKESRIGPHDFKPENLSNVCPPAKAQEYWFMCYSYDKLHKNVRLWVHNQLIQSPIITKYVPHPPPGQELSEYDRKANEIHLRFHKATCLIIIARP